MIDVAIDGKLYQEMHVDGGAIAQAFLYPASFNLKAKMKELGVKLRSSGSYCSSFDDRALAAGRGAGDRASFGRPVNGPAGQARIGRAPET